MMLSDWILNYKAKEIHKKKLNVNVIDNISSSSSSSPSSFLYEYELIEERRTYNPFESVKKPGSELHEVL